MEFSEKLKAARAANGWSQAVTAERIQVPKRTIENWESGARTAPEYVQRLVLKEITRLGKERNERATAYHKKMMEKRIQLYYRNLDDYKAALEQARSYWLNDKAVEICRVELCSGRLHEGAFACFSIGSFIGLSSVYTDGKVEITNEQAFEML